jgi:hypothetical protein
LQVKDIVGADIFLGGAAYFDGQIEQVNVMLKERVGIAKVISAPFGIQAVGEIVTKGMDSATRTHACFQHSHVVSGIHEFKSGSQPGDPRSNDYHFLGPTDGASPFRAPGKKPGQKGESCP